MKAENIKRANEIIEQLDKLRIQALNWNQCNRFTDGTVKADRNQYNERTLYSRYLNFDVCKALALVSIDKEIKELEAELETL